MKNEFKSLKVAVPLSEQEKVKEVFETLARDCMVMLNEAAGNKGVRINKESEVGWGLFKMVNKVCRKRMQTTAAFLTHFFDKS